MVEVNLTKCHYSQQTQPWNKLVNVQLFEETEVIKIFMPFEDYPITKDKIIYFLCLRM